MGCPAFSGLGDDTGVFLCFREESIQRTVEFGIAGVASGTEEQHRAELLVGGAEVDGFVVDGSGECPVAVGQADGFEVECAVKF